MKTQGNKRLTITLIVLGILVLAVAGAMIAKSLTTSDDQAKTTTPVTTTDDSDTDSSTEADIDKSTPTETAPATTVDPSTLSSVAIEPLGVKVFYVKGIAGFDFAVKRTADSTEYVEFSSAELTGTKCTGDEGSFASIIKNPAAGTQQTIDQTIKVGNDTYGLSLAGEDCTANTALLRQYQASFTDGFKSLTTL